MSIFKNSTGAGVVKDIILAIHTNAAYLSEVDGATRDGDHGINMDKGFLMADEKIRYNEMSFSEALKTLGRVLVMDIGGSMGPIYGAFFSKICRTIGKEENITLALMNAAICAALDGIKKLGSVSRGDKTLIDCLEPASETLNAAVTRGKSFADGLKLIAEAGESGKESTRDMVAKLGRAARLGERSRGRLDAGSVSCCIIITTMAHSIQKMLVEEVV